MHRRDLRYEKTPDISPSVPARTYKTPHSEALNFVTMIAEKDAICQGLASFHSKTSFSVFLMNADTRFHHDFSQEQPRFVMDVQANANLSLASLSAFANDSLREDLISLEVFTLSLFNDNNNKNNYSFTHKCFSGFDVESDQEIPAQSIYCGENIESNSFGLAQKSACTITCTALTLQNMLVRPQLCGHFCLGSLSIH